VSLGRDSYHVEAVVEASGTVRLYTLGADETRVIDIPAAPLQGFYKVEGDADSQSITFTPASQPGDAEGRASSFTAELPSEARGRGALEFTIPNVAIDGERFRLAFSTATRGGHSDASMPDKVSDDEERRLYLEPGGHYTDADIAANGRMTASQKFKGIASAHDMNPKVGDRICPVTETKANPKFSWTIGGKEYLFCCPPCVDEFLQAAKESSEPLPEPESFVKKASSP
jgi:YHS domain-containing protein